MNKFLRKLFSSRRRLNISKRQEFIFATGILTLALMCTQIFTGSMRFDVMVALGGLSAVLAGFILREHLRGWEFLTLLTLPVFYTGAVFVFYFLLPTRWVTRLPIAFLYAIGMYAILLTENIYNVAAARTIQLLRAAHSVGFLLTLVTLFFLTDTLLSLKLPFYTNILFGTVIVVPLTIQALWAMELTEKISPRAWFGTLIISLIMVELFFTFSFWPIRTTIEALFLTTVFYTLVGMTQQYLVGRLFLKTSREFLGVLLLVFFLVLMTTRWGSGLP